MTRFTLRALGLGALVCASFTGSLGFSDEVILHDKSVPVAPEGSELGNSKIRYDNVLMGISTYYPMGWNFSHDFDNAVQFTDPVEQRDAGEVTISVEVLPEVKTSAQLEQYLRETYPEDEWNFGQFKERPSFESMRKRTSVRYILKSEEQVLRVEASNNSSELTAKNVQDTVDLIQWQD